MFIHQGLYYHIVCLIVLMFLRKVISHQTPSQNNIQHPFGVKVYTLGETKLREPCLSVTSDQILHDPSIQQACNDAHLALATFREKKGFGRAIAAPQVGHSIRMIAMNYQGTKHTLFNPMILTRSSEVFTMWDDCLSFPDLLCCVSRNKHISIQFLDEKGCEQSWKHCSQDLSELLQHEIDHLDGILAVDRAIKPLKGKGSCEAIISREIYEINRKQFNKLVDFSYELK